MLVPINQIVKMNFFCSFCLLVGDVKNLTIKGTTDHLVLLAVTSRMNYDVYDMLAMPRRLRRWQLQQCLKSINRINSYSCNSSSNNNSNSEQQI